jgi:hypothetical protein
MRDVFLLQGAQNSLFYPTAHSLILWSHNSHIGILYVGEKWLLLEDFFKFLNQIELSAKQRRRRGKEVREGRGVHVTVRTWQKPSFREATERIPMDEED